MAQLARPIADTQISGWTTQIGGGSNLYQTIDEVAADDADFVRSSLSPASDIYVCKLGPMLDPLSSIGHTVRYRYAKDAAGGAPINIQVQLRQGYVSEIPGQLGSLIASWTHADISDVLTTAVQVLSGVEADAITNYSSLFLRFEAFAA